MQIVVQHRNDLPTRWLVTRDNSQGAAGMTTSTLDTIVIGAGSAGLAYARTAAKLGAKVMIVEREHLGGTCVNRGCVPKKILWAAGALEKNAKDAAAVDVATETKVDFQKLVTKRDTHIEGIRSSFESDLDQQGITLLRGDAKLINSTTVQINGDEYTANYIVLATGGRPSKMDIPGADLLSDSNNVLSWSTLPEKLVIVGGGYIGCEFAAIFNALGVTVTIIHNGPYLLDTFPEALAKHAQENLSAAGIEIILDDALASVSQTADVLAYTSDEGAQGNADAVVCAVGRTPNIDQLGNFAEMLETADTGALAVSDRLETSCVGVYAIGDVADRLPLTPVATADGTTLAHILHGDGATPVDLDLVATTAFLYPPAAFVGTCGNSPHSSDTVTPLEKNIITPSSDHDPDFFAINVDDAAQVINGVALAAEKAEDLIAMAAALIAAKASPDAFKAATPIHPSFAEEFFVED